MMSAGAVIREPLQRGIVEAVVRPDVRGFGVRKTIALKGPLSDTEQLRLHLSSEYRMVRQLFTKGTLAVEDQVTCSAQTTAPKAAVAAAQVLQPPLTTVPACLLGAETLGTPRKNEHDDSR